MSEDSSRRRFISGGLSSLIGITSKQFFNIFPEANHSGVKRSDPIIPDNLKEGRLENSFLILPAGADVPDFVIPANKTTPNMCAVGMAPDEYELYDNLAINERPNTVDELGHLIDFKFYTWDEQLKSELRLQSPSIIRHPTGEIYSVSIGIEANIEKEEKFYWMTSVRLYAFPDFSNPYILREPDEKEFESVSSELGDLGKCKAADYLKTPGIVTKSVDGYVFFWIEEGILFILITEEGLDLQESLEVVNTLEAIKS